MRNMTTVGVENFRKVLDLYFTDKPMKQPAVHWNNPQRGKHKTEKLNNFTNH